MYTTIRNSDTDTNNNRYNVYKRHNNRCYIRWRKMIEKLHKNAFVEKYPSGHIKKVVRYVRNIYQIPFSHMKIYIDVSIQISHIVYMS